MIKKILLGGLAGGAVLFVWGALAWMVLPLHEGTVRNLPDEAAVIRVLKMNAKETGVYSFPGFPKTSGMSREQANEALQRWKIQHREGPTGFLVLHPHGLEPMNLRHFVGSFVIQCISALVAAWLLLRAADTAGYWGRVFFVMVLGVFAGLVVDLPYWNRFGFPRDYTVTAMVDHVIGWALAGLAMAGIVKQAPPAKKKKD